MGLDILLLVRKSEFGQLLKLLHTNLDHHLILGLRRLISLLLHSHGLHLRLRISFGLDASELSLLPDVSLTHFYPGARNITTTAHFLVELGQCLEFWFLYQRSLNRRILFANAQLI